jgi:hypothetical protein
MAEVFERFITSANTQGVASWKIIGAHRLVAQRMYGAV